MEIKQAEMPVIRCRIKDPNTLDWTDVTETVLDRVYGRYGRSYHLGLEKLIQALEDWRTNDGEFATDGWIPERDKEVIIYG